MVGRSDLHGDGIFGVDDIAGPVDVDRTGDVALVVLIARGQVLSLLAAVPEVPFLHVPANVHDPDTGLVQVFGEPLRLRQGIEVLHELYPSSKRSCSRAYVSARFRAFSVSSLPRRPST